MAPKEKARGKGKEIERASMFIEAFKIIQVNKLDYFLFILLIYFY